MLLTGGRGLCWHEHLKECMCHKKCVNSALWQNGKPHLIELHRSDKTEKQFYVVKLLMAGGVHQ